MEISYLILAHKNPAQLRRLVLRLSTPGVFFYVHIDRGSPIAPFVAALGGIAGVYLSPDHQRVHSHWGDIGTVRGTLNMLGQALADGRQGYVVLISGQDYPLKSNAAISEFLDTHDGAHFINKFPLPCPYWNGGGMDRIERYKINYSLARGDYVLLPSVWEKEFYHPTVFRTLYQLLKRRRYSALIALLKRRRFPSHMKPYGGDQWWALPIATGADIVRFVSDQPGYLEYCKYGLLPDEMFFQSLCVYLSEHRAPLTFMGNLTYVNWTRPNVPLPVLFTAADFDELREQTNKLFARKFDSEADSAILDKLDVLIAEPSRLP